MIASSSLGLPALLLHQAVKNEGRGARGGDRGWFIRVLRAIVWRTVAMGTNSGYRDFTVVAVTVNTIVGTGSTKSSSVAVTAAAA